MAVASLRGPFLISNFGMGQLPAFRIPAFYPQGFKGFQTRQSEMEGRERGGEGRRWAERGRQGGQEKEPQNGGRKGKKKKPREREREKKTTERRKSAKREHHDK